MKNQRKGEYYFHETTNTVDLRFHSHNDRKLCFTGRERPVQFRPQSAGPGLHRLHLPVYAVLGKLSASHDDLPGGGGALAGPREPEKGDLCPGLPVCGDLFPAVPAAATITLIKSPF